MNVKKELIETLETINDYLTKSQSEIDESLLINAKVNALMALQKYEDDSQ